MTPASIRVLSLTLLAIAFIVTPSSSFARLSADDLQRVQELLRASSRFSPDPCGGPVQEGDDGKTGLAVLDLAAKLALGELNAGTAGVEGARARAAAGLKNLEQESAKVNSAWPERNRFHFELLDVGPALVLKVSFRMVGVFVAFGTSADTQGNRSQVWQEIGRNNEAQDEAVPWSWREIDLFLLHCGPSGNPRFLARIVGGGCAGSYGIVYEGREWNPTENIGLEEILRQEGAFGLDQQPEGTKPSKLNPFVTVGKLRTEGTRITLPYCWFSAIDWWDNPSLCSEDTYDLSGDSIKFVARRYNRPDLVAIAKAIEYAGKHDFPAVIGYCANAAVARKLVDQIPDMTAAENPQITRLSDERERIAIGGSGTEFDLAKRKGRWVIASYRGD